MEPAWKFRLLQAGAALTAAGAIGAWGHENIQRPGIYAARTFVVLYPPQNEAPANPLDNRIRGTIDLAGITARSVAGLGKGNKGVSGEISLTDQNITHGWSVRQPSVGGQWNYAFDDPAIEVQVTGSTAIEVATTTQDIVRRIREDIRDREAAADVGPDMHVQTLLSPSTPAVTYATGSSTRAQAGVALLMLIGAVAAIRLTDLADAAIGRKGRRNLVSGPSWPTAAPGRSRSKSARPPVF